MPGRALPISNLEGNKGEAADLFFCFVVPCSSKQTLLFGRHNFFLFLSFLAFSVPFSLSSLLFSFFLAISIYPDMPTPTQGSWNCPLKLQKTRGPEKGSTAPLLGGAMSWAFY